MKIVVGIIIIILSQAARAYVEFPKQCLMSVDSVCHFGTVKENSTYHESGLRIFLGKNTLLKKENGLIEWVYGSVLFEVSSKRTVSYKKNIVTLQKGKYLFFGADNVLKVEVLEGNFGFGKFQVTEGFQASFIVSENKISLEPLQAIDLKEHLVRYVNVKNLNIEQAKEYLEEFSLKHKNYIAWLEELNQKLIKRSIAHDQRVLELERDSKERARVAQEKRRMAFFNKVFER